MKKFGVMGWPVRHSLSPAMHTAAFAACGIDASYELLPTPPAEVVATVRRLPEEGFSGWNVTVPHKAAVSACMDSLVGSAAAVGSVNTVVVEPGSGRLLGHSTDGYGLAMALAEHFSWSAKDNRLALVGGGGAVCATAVYLAMQGVVEMVLINRTLSRIDKIARIIGEAAPGCRVFCLGIDDLGAVKRVLARLPLLVQGTSLGLHEDDPWPLPPEVVPPEMAVMDMIYGNPGFLRELKRRGHRQLADGRSMLLHQGARSFSLWTGQAAPLAAMRQALEEAIS